MVSNVVEQKLESLRRCLSRIEARCPATVEELAQDIDAQDVVVLNLSRAVQLCTDIALHLLSQKSVVIPNTMGAAFAALSQENVISPQVAEHMRKAVGFRNLAVHSYDEIDWQIVHSIATTRLKDFREFAVSVTC